MRGRRIEPPSGLPVRPTTDMARESLFNILNNYVDYDDCTVLDLFAGTGAVSVEFVSRGAADVTSVDVNNACCDFIRRTAERLALPNLHVVRADALELLKRHSRKYDIIFADPPYNMEESKELPGLVFDKELLTPDGIFVLEHPANLSFADHPHFWQHRAYGKVNFTFFAMELNDE